MRKFVLVFATIMAALAILVAPVGAITGNYIQDFEHPFVGLIVFYDASGQFSHRCSGSLLSPKVVLTAGHCTEGVNSARVYFQQDAGANFNGTIDPVTGYPETCAAGTLGVLCATSDEIYNYGYPAGFPNTKDVGLVILDQSISVAEYGELATAGSLDQLATQRGQQQVSFTPSGYGVSRINPVQFQSFRERLMAEAKLVNLRSALTGGFNIQTSANPGNGRGGTCFGDSGGPIFYGGFSSNTIVAVTSFGLNNNCRGVDFSYRTDQAAVIDWILDTVPSDQAGLIQIVDL